MTQLILKNDINRQQLDMLLQLLQSRGIEAEVLPQFSAQCNVAYPIEEPVPAIAEPLAAYSPVTKLQDEDDTDDEKIASTKTDAPYAAFNKCIGMWANRDDITAEELRRRAWGNRFSK
jgi:uncharacterized protein YbaR (Trm112 family)